MQVYLLENSMLNSLLKEFKWVIIYIIMFMNTKEKK